MRERHRCPHLADAVMVDPERMEDAQLIVRVAKVLGKFERAGQSSTGLRCPVPRDLKRYPERRLKHHFPPGISNPASSRPWIALSAQTCHSPMSDIESQSGTDAAAKPMPVVKSPGGVNAHVSAARKLSTSSARAADALSNSALGPKRLKELQEVPRMTVGKRLQFAAFLRPSRWHRRVSPRAAESAVRENPHQRQRAISSPIPALRVTISSPEWPSVAGDRCGGGERKPTGEDPNREKTSARKGSAGHSSNPAQRAWSYGGASPAGAHP